MVYYPTPLHGQTVYKDIRHEGHCPVTEESMCHWAFVANTSVFYRRRGGAGV